MERLVDQYDMEYMKVAMLKHEETFREQVYELHRLYQIQKILMKDISKEARIDPMSYNNRAKSRSSGRPVELKIKYDGSDLELTLGPRSYYERKVKGGGPVSDNSGPGFLWSSTGSGHIKEGERNGSKQEVMKWGPDPSASNQDSRLNSGSFGNGYSTPLALI